MKFSGVVKKNLGRGRKLGFPTANIDAPEDIEDGLYTGLVHIHTVVYDGKPRQSIVFIGAAETFGDKQRKAEIFILDFDENLYGLEISVEVLKKIRENKKFESQEALIEQMRHDEQVARNFFKSYN